MKREEAISEWTFRSNHIKKWLEERGEEPSIRHYVELIDMTIEALSAEAKGRLYIRIYADDEPSVKAEKLYQICGETQNREVTEWLKEYFPSAEAVQGWRTGKPTKSGKYIVTLIGIGDYRFVGIMHYDKPFMPNREVDGTCWYMDDDEWGDVVYDDKDILAWVPLPTPYKGGDSE